ncbi:helix-turn-helix domain-containing protein [Moraxella osloensis]|jgi:SOS-response transcriptional repressor LexA|nr:S24 family peptidase [Moraxella osloensis]MBW4016943.1 helix-turn-helix domain-containing protein [Moraxella osloensis]MBW4019162.1 helix-turn-helix domain-containing protein [Moraxella osloensis]TGP43089.1 helix-turn-helix domain-containing protein [bacterium M00.F.Ca.ET.230.01.1.1]VWX31823.1 conserved hypothetical protein [Moraxellaceae bacterium 17A]
MNFIYIPMRYFQMCGITERIIERANQLKLKQSDIIKATGASKATVNNWFNYDRKPSVQYLEALANVLNVSIQWLVTGIDINGNSSSLGLTNLRKAPILTLSEVTEFQKYIISVEDFTRAYKVFSDANFSDEVFWVQMEGDNSMFPVFTDNDLVLIDAKKQPRTGNCVIAVIDNDAKATLRKFRLCYDNKADKEYYELIAINEFYPAIDSRRQRFQIKGVAVKHERTLI